MPQDFFILRPEHEKAFAVAGLLRFKAKARRLLRERHQALLDRVDDAELAGLINNWTEVSRQAGLVTEKQMFRYFEAGVLLRHTGVPIERDETSATILSAVEHSPEERSSMVRTEALGRVSPAEKRFD